MPCQAVKPSRVLMPVTVYLSCYSHLSPGVQQCHADTQPWCSLTAMHGIGFLTCSSSSVGAASELLPQMAQPRSLTPAQVLGTGEGRWCLQFTPHPGEAQTSRDAGEHPEPSPHAPPAGGSSKAAGKKGSDEGLWLHCICSRVLQREPGC